MHGNELVPDVLAALRQDLIKHGQYTLSLVPKLPSNPFEATVACSVSNTVAWHMIHGTLSPEALEAALALINRAIPYIESYQHHFLYDTQVRFLLKLERREEAYAIVQRVLTDDPGFPD